MLSSPLRIHQQPLSSTANAVAYSGIASGDCDPALSPTSKAKGIGRTTPTSSFVAPTTATRSSAFRSIINNNDSSSNKQWVTREIAALEFLQIGIPMASEKDIVHEGWTRQQLQQQQRAQQQVPTRFVDLERGITNDSQDNADGITNDDNNLLRISPALLPLERNSNNLNLNSDIIIPQGRWWEKWIMGQNLTAIQQQQQERQKNGGTVDARVSQDNRIGDLEEPNDLQQQQDKQQETQTNNQTTMLTTATATIYAPGRRLQGDTATKIQIPFANTLNTTFRGGVVSSDVKPHLVRQNSDILSLQLTKQQSVARMSVTREWEVRVAHGLKNHHLNHQQQQQQQQQSQLSPQEKRHNNPLLDGRMYFSAKESYPVMVFSLLRYEPKKEEAIRLRKKLEERGGGGTQFFIMPPRDWRGISFRSLLQRSDHDDHDNNDGNGRSIVHQHIATATRRKKNNNNRLLFDRFAAKKITPKGALTIDTAEKAKQNNEENSNNNVQNDDDDDDINSDDDDEVWSGEDTYKIGLLDDPEMVQGRHRNVMIGDRGTGPIVSSTIQFVKPKLLKADLNKRFRERFDGYEPPVSQRKYIGAKVIDGVYTLLDPTQTTDNEVILKNGEHDGYDDGNDDDDTTGTNTVGTSTASKIGTTTMSVRTHRKRGSTSSISLSSAGGGGGGGDSCDGGGEGKETIRMPPSLTLSKIRSLKQQALTAAVKAKLEISTVALAIIYFERLCLDCRVDKTNRRLSFAACLMLAIKINEPNVEVIITKAIANPTKKSRTSQRIQSLIRPHKKSSTMFASLLEFFTQDWNISLKHLYAAEWTVFAALQFRLKAKPSDVAFHFKRLTKALGYDTSRYLGVHMYGQWQEALTEEEFRRQELKSRVKTRRQRKEKKKLEKLKRELEAANRSDNSAKISIDEGSMGGKHCEKSDGEICATDLNLLGEGTPTTKRRLGLGDLLKTRLGGGTAAQQKRSLSIERPWTRNTSWKDLPKTANNKRMSIPAANNTNVATVAGALKPRQQTQSLRPLSHSKSMLSLTTFDREVVGKIIVVDKNNKPPVPLQDTEEDNRNIKGRRPGSERNLMRGDTDNDNDEDNRKGWEF